MKVKLKTVYASPTRSGRPGQILEFTEEEGGAIIAGGYGEEVGAVIDDEATDEVTELLDSTVNEIVGQLPALTLVELRKLSAAEEAGNTRNTLISAIEKEIISRDES